MNTKPTKLVALLLSFGLFAAACSSTADDATEAVGGATDAIEETLATDDEGEGEEVTEDEETTDEDATDEEAAVEDEEEIEDEVVAENDASDIPATVVDVALASDDFSILAAALSEADLVETLQGNGPFTVFAPTDDAFEEFFTAAGITAEDLLATSDLTDTLTSHVIVGQFLAEDAIAADGTAVSTVAGTGISIDVIDGMVTLNRETTVVTADLVAGNGVVHIIDSVLIPGSGS